MKKFLNLNFIPDDLFLSSDHDSIGSSFLWDDSYLDDDSDHRIIVCFDDFDSEDDCDSAPF